VDTVRPGEMAFPYKVAVRRVDEMAGAADTLPAADDSTAPAKPNTVQLGLQRCSLGGCRVLVG